MWCVGRTSSSVMRRNRTSGNFTRMRLKGKSRMSNRNVSSGNKLV